MGWMFQRIIADCECNIIKINESLTKWFDYETKQKGLIIPAAKEHYIYATLHKNCVFLNRKFWNYYRQSYSFSKDWRSYYSVSDINNMSGSELLYHMDRLAYNSFYVKDTHRKLSDFINDIDYLSSHSYLNIDGYFISVLKIDNFVYILISPCNKKGQINSEKSIVLSFNCKKSVLMNIKQITNELSIKLKSTQKKINDSIIMVLKYVLYLSICNDKELPEEIKHCETRFSHTNYGFDESMNIDVSEIDGSLLNIEEITQPNIVYTFYNKDNGIGKCTHSRRGHYHRFWVGKGENKKLQTKWVNATVINEGKSTLNKVVHTVV